jgi:hypothetical protein
MVKDKSMPHPCTNSKKKGNFKEKWLFMEIWKSENWG